MSIEKLTWLLVWRFNWAREMYSGRTFSPLALMSVTFLKSNWKKNTNQKRWQNRIYCIPKLWHLYINKTTNNWFQVKICHKEVSNHFSSTRFFYLDIDFFAKELGRRISVDQKTTSGFVVATWPMHLAKLGLNDVDSIKIETKMPSLNATNRYEMN